jgi:hypothetical protein
LDIVAWSSSNSSLVFGFIVSIPKAVLVSATLTTPIKTNQLLVNKKILKIYIFQGFQRLDIFKVNTI